MGNNEKLLFIRYAPKGALSCALQKLGSVGHSETYSGHKLRDDIGWKEVYWTLCSAKTHGSLMMKAK